MASFVSGDRDTRSLTPRGVQLAFRRAGLCSVPMQSLTWTRTCKPYNQDAVATRQTTVCVVDGATPLVPVSSAVRDTAEFARALADGISEYVTSPDNVREQVQRGLASAQRMSRPMGSTAAFSLAVWDDDHVAVACLGDVKVVVKTRGGDVEVCDPAFAGRGGRAVDEVRAQLRAGVSPASAYGTVMAWLRRDRALRNTPAGVCMFPRADVLAVAVLSDGASELSSTFELCHADELRWRSDAAYLDSLYDAAVRIQDRDAEKTRFLRISDRDDASLARVVLPGV